MSLISAVKKNPDRWVGIPALLILVAVHGYWLRMCQKWLDQSLLKAVAAQNPDMYPPPVPWGYSEVVWMPACLAVSLLLFFLCYRLLLLLKISKLLATAICVMTFLVTVTANIPSAHYLAAKRQALIAFLILSAAALWYFRDRLKDCYNLLNSDGFAWRGALVLVAISTIQRLIEMKAAIQWLADDPLTFHQRALSLAIHGSLPDSTFSPAMSFYLGFFYRVFGVGFYLPKLVLIALAIPSLLLLYRVVVRHYGGPIVGLLTLAAYLLNSQYVAFSNGFWNENLFVLSVPPFLYLLHSIQEESELRQRIISGFVLGALAYLMTLMRSWMPAVLLVCLAAVFFSGRNSKDLLNRASVTAVPLLVFSLLSLGYSFLQSELSDGQRYVTSNFALIVVAGNNPFAHGSWTNHINTYARSIGLEGKPMNEVLPHLIEYCIANPTHLLLMFLKKALIWFWGGANPKYFSGYYISPNTLAAYYWRMVWFFLSVAGFYSMWKKNMRLPLFFYLSMTIVFIAMIVEHRFLILGFPLQAIAVAVLLSDILKTFVTSRITLSEKVESTAEN